MFPIILLRGTLAVNEFVNADVIARDLSAADPDSAAIAAGRVMLTRLRGLAGQRVRLRVRDNLGEPDICALASGAPGLRTPDSFAVPLVAIGGICGRAGCRSGLHVVWRGNTGPIDPPQAAAVVTGH